MISGFLGDGYVVESSIGHIRDLPRNAADVPAKYKGESWARLGVDVDNGFEPLYVVSPDHRQQVTKLRDLLKNATELYLATDEDREGEAIAWHLVRDAQAAGADPPHGVPRDHPGGDPARGGQPARHRRRPGRRAGDPAHPRPAVRLRGQPGAVEEGHAEALGGPGAVRGDPAGRGARTGPDAVPVRRVLGHRGPVRPRRAAGRRRPGDVHRDAGRRSTTAASPPAGTSTRRPAPPAATSCTWTSPAPVAWSPACRTRPSRSPGSRRSPTGAGRTRRS